MREGTSRSHVKYAILDFVDDLAIRNVSDHVQYSYIERLEIVARIMGPGFLEPNRRIVKETMLSLKRSKSRRNDYYYDSTLNSIYVIQ